MEDKIVIAVAVALLSGVCVVYTQSQNCQNSFVLSLYQCLGNRSIDRENFLWLTRNGTLGREPADLQSFTSRVCIEKSGLLMCVKTALDNALAIPEAQCSQAQKSSLTSLFKGIFKNLETKCQDPCRASFANDLAKCYTDKMFNGPDYLLFNVSSRRDAVLGTNTSEVERFCQERTSIMQCLKTTALNCNDATFMLRSFGLDFQALNDTYNVLCNYTAVYLGQTTCFREPVQQLRTCRDAAGDRVARLEMELADLNITDSEFSDEICSLRFDHIWCEMSATRQINDTQKCPNVVFGLRKQQECMLVPYDCRIKNPSRLASTCRIQDFLIPDRDSYSGNTGHAHTSTSAQLFQIVLLTLCLISMLSK